MGIVTAWRPPHGVDRKAMKTELKKMLAPFGGMGVFICAGDHVMIKPDVGLPSGPEEGLVTDRNLVGAMIELALEAGAASVTVAESADVSFDTINNFCLSKYDYMCYQCGGDLLDLKESVAVKRRVPQALLMDEITVYQPPLVADVLINMPSLKVLTDGRFCGATMNLLGVLPDEEKDRLRASDLERGLFDLSKLIVPDLTILDGLMVNNKGTCENLDMILVGADAVAIDTIAATVLGFEPTKIEYLQLAEQYGLASAQPLNITIYGDDLSPLMNRTK